jgi:uncharacterized SAM-binding protein YcdF (DUF218 family)
MANRTGPKILKWTFLVVLLLVAGEALFSLLIGPDQPPAESVDLIIAFKGIDEDRIKTAYSLLQGGAASRISIPGASQKTLTHWDRKYGLPRTVSHLNGPAQTRSTFEDSIQARDLIEHHALKNIVLVTSDYHLPRSWLLLRGMTFGNGVKIYSVGVESGKNPSGIWHHAKLTYNEMVKFWGSLCEMAYFKITGQLLYENPTAAKTARWLKEHLLFDVREKAEGRGQRAEKLRRREVRSEK